MATLVVSTTSGSTTNTTTKTYSSSDANRYFKAWQTAAGPKDAQGNPTGTQAQFTRWCADLIHAQLDSFVTRNEQTVVTPPPVTTVDS